MSYYDNVKNNVKDDDDTGKPNFETLRKAAEETSENEDEDGDDTEIEVLEDGLGKKESSEGGSGGLDSMDLNKKAGPSSSQGQENMDQSSQDESQVSQSRSKKQPQRASSDSSQDLSSLEDKLDTIIDQNQRMIEILESFGG